MSMGQRNGYVLPVHRLFCQATALAYSASNYYNMAIYFHPIAGAHSLSVCVSVSFSPPNSVSPSLPQTFSASLVNTPLSLTTLRANLDPREKL